MKRWLVRARRKVRRSRPGPTDVLAGISMAFVLIPQALAYATLAGLPAYTGLFAAALPPIAAAFFASSPYLQTGPTAVTSILVAGTLAALAPAGVAQYALLASLLAIIVGIIRVGIGLMSAGKIVYLMSDPVLRGFTAAAALLILLSQLPVILGLPDPPGPRVFTSLRFIVSEFRAWRVEPMLLAGSVFAILYVTARVHPLVPGVLVATIAGLAYSVLTDYGGSVVGAVPSALPRLTIGLPWSALPSLVLPGVVIALVGFSEAASIARMYAARERKPWDPDRDFISQGAANLAAGLTGAFPVGGSFSRSALSHRLGTRSAWSGAITGFTVLLFMPFARLLAPLPTAVLGALVIVAVFRLVQVQPIVDLWRLSRPQFFVAAGTFVLTLLLSPRIDEAVVLGIGFAIAVHLWREFKVKLTTWVERESLHIRPEGVLWFGSAQELEKDVLRLVAEHDGVRRLVLHMERIGRVDLTASIVIANLVKEARSGGLETEIISIHPTTAKALHRVLRETQPKRPQRRRDATASD